MGGVIPPQDFDALKEAGVYTRFMTDDSRFSYMVEGHGFDVIDQPPVHTRTFTFSLYQPHARAFATFAGSRAPGVCT